MTVGAVDIGTNSMRLLITDGIEEKGRWVEVTGLGVGVDASGVLSAEAVERTIAVLGRFGRLMDDAGVDRRAAVATSATRDAANTESFLGRAEEALGVQPLVISGAEEGRLAYAGATRDLEAPVGWLVSDIGGGSTEFVTTTGTTSVDIGSVRLTDRTLPDRPADPAEVDQARAQVMGLFAGLADTASELIGVAGTWTSLAAIDLDLARYEHRSVHHHRLERVSLEDMTSRLAAMTVEQTASIPSLDPARAPVILAGAVVACCVLDVCRADSALVSETDSLDGLAQMLLAVP